MYWILIESNGRLVACQSILEQGMVVVLEEPANKHIAVDAEKEAKGDSSDDLNDLARLVAAVSRHECRYWRRRRFRQASCVIATQNALVSHAPDKKIVENNELLSRERRRAKQNGRARL